MRRCLEHLETGEVVLTKPSIAAVERHNILGWEVSIDGALKNERIRQRAAKLPSETGGVLLGIIDVQSRKVQLVDALEAPPDSVETPCLFERGIGGLTEEVTKNMARTMDQVRYVGEWHSHPPRYSLRPSGTDLEQLGWLARVTSLGSAGVDDYRGRPKGKSSGWRREMSCVSHRNPATQLKLGLALSGGGVKLPFFTLACCAA